MIDTFAIKKNLDEVQRQLTAARKHAPQDAESAGFLVRRLSLIAQFVSLAAHDIPESVPGVAEMRSIWGAAVKACEVAK